MARPQNMINLQSAAELLGVAVSANDAELRSAYLKQIQLYPPDRDPERFERIRDAYDRLRNPAVRAKAILEGPNPSALLVTLMDGLTPNRHYAGSQLWIELLQEKRS